MLTKNEKKEKMGGREEKLTKVEDGSDHEIYINIGTRRPQSIDLLKHT